MPPRQEHPASRREPRRRSRNRGGPPRPRRWPSSREASKRHDRCQCGINRRRNDGRDIWVVSRALGIAAASEPDGVWLGETRRVRASHTGRTDGRPRIRRISCSVLSGPHQAGWRSRPGPERCQSRRRATRCSAGGALAHETFAPSISIRRSASVEARIPSAEIFTLGRSHFAPIHTSVTRATAAAAQIPARSTSASSEQTRFGPRTTQTRSGRT